MARGEIHGVAHQAVLHATLAAHVAGQDLTHGQAHADAQDGPASFQPLLAEIHKPQLLCDRRIEGELGVLSTQVDGHLRRPMAPEGALNV